MTIINFITYFFLIIIFLRKINACSFTPEYELEIFNGLPPGSPPLTFRCASKDNDLGYHTLNVNQTYQWTFCQNFVRNTLYFCNFQWGTKRQAFEVFSQKLPECRGGLCFWLAKSDGIYFKSYTSNLVKKFDWQ
ncbi:hypothetical protein DH2020_008163 [Rehmannia glutinosa]|uniref:S-protein homolog n=1 Tax=Rehmannia glutinosa TaxID=99300 RepID=A0ABR0U078_REHGL